MKLYSYWRSGTSYRVRIALAIKGASVEIVPVNLLDGAHKDESFLTRNPQGLVPTLELDDGTLLSQSPAIIEYLDETLPGPELLPEDPLQRAEARHLSALIGCDIHPLQNLRVLKYLQDPLGHNRDEAFAWAAHFIAAGFEALETLLSKADTPFAMGDAPGVVECYLLPQLYAARRFGTDLSAVPRLLAIEKAAADWPDITAAHPEQQIDAH
ncbi:MAG: maleylacetoacetate isomerase [Pseudomonadota bacterium]